MPKKFTVFSKLEECPFFLSSSLSQPMSFEASESIEKKMLHFDRKGKHKKVGFHQIKIVQSALEMYSSALISSKLLRGLCRHCQVMPADRSTFKKSDLKSV